MKRHVTIRGKRFDLVQVALAALTSFALWWAKGYYADTQAAMKDLQARVSTLEQRQGRMHQALIDSGLMKKSP